MSDVLLSQTSINKGLLSICSLHKTVPVDAGLGLLQSKRQQHIALTVKNQHISRPKALLAITFLFVCSSKITDLHFCHINNQSPKEKYCQTVNTEKSCICFPKRLTLHITAKLLLSKHTTTELPLVCSH